MPKALNVDWTAMQAMYTKGLRLSDIAREMKVSEPALRARALRYNWKAFSTKANEALQQAVVTNLATRGESWASRIVVVIEGLLAHIERLEPSKRNVDELEKLVRVLKSLDDVGRRTFRLDEAAASTAKLVSGPVIDVSYPAPARLPETTTPDTPEPPGNPST